MKEYILGCFIISCASYCEAQQEGTLLWSFEASNRMACVASISDVNGNGIADVLAGKFFDTLYCFDGGSKDTATIIWKFAMGWNDDFVDVTPIPDVNNDGIEDVVTGCTGGNHSYCLDGQNGNIIWWFSEPVWTYTFVEPIGDVNGDGICDVILGLRSPHKIYCIDGASIDTANVLWEFPVAGCLRSKYSISSLNDIDGDSVSDKQPESWAYCLSGRDGDTLWLYDVPEAIAQCVSPIEDVNNNGTQDVLVGTQGLDAKVYCLEGNNGDIIWESDTSGDKMRVIAISDINGDGKQEVIADASDYGGNDYSILCIDGNTGNVLWNCPTFWIPNHLDVISDVDGDSIPDIVAGTWGGFVYCLSAKAGSVIWRYHGPDTSVFADIMGLTGITDVNGDGFDDVAGVTYNRKAWCLSGKSYVGVEESEELRVKSLELRVSQNPFIKATEIRGWGLGVSEKQEVKIYDIAGKMVQTIPISAQQSQMPIGQDLAPGVYFVRVKGYEPLKIIKIGRVR
ncbi:MAG: T9SS type A sorting domain-containing protein [Candidatus Stahlbacteria bacterium]|nr:T9SS type A sorting domain-containing protein [Candidatus Stahlbacteria bacterium]